jgi:signal transduction histidine kinase
VHVEPELWAWCPACQRAFGLVAPPEAESLSATCPTCGAKARTVRRVAPQASSPVSGTAPADDTLTEQHGHGVGAAQTGVIVEDLLHDVVEVTGMRDGLWRLVSAVVGMAAAEPTPAAVLDRIVEVAADLVDADYAALGVLDDDRRLREFVHTGVDAELVARMGRLPKQHGVLGLLLRDPRVLRLDDVTTHPAAAVLPVHHPQVEAFLGAPIAVGDRVLGNLYLANDRGGRAFTDEDVELVTMLAAMAGVVIDSARVHELEAKRRNWLEAACDVTAAMLDGAGTIRVRRLVVERLRLLTGAATCALAVADGESLVVVAADGTHADTITGRRVALHGSAEDDARRAGHAIRVGDRTTARLATLPDGHGPAFVVPLSVRDRMVGFVTAAHEHGCEPPSGNDLRAAEILARHAALALDHEREQARRRVTAVMSDRERISHDLHDVVIQRLFAAGLQLDDLASRVADDETADRIGHAVGEIDAAIADLRSSIFALDGRRRGAATVGDQLEELCRISRHALGFTPTCEIDPAVDAAAPDEIVADLLATARELLSNAARHADASTVGLRLVLADDTVRLTVTDDGRGIPGDVQRRSGLLNLAARARHLGGSFDIDTDATGTRVRWFVPLA